MAKNTKNPTNKKERDFDDQMHWYGRIWTGIALCLMLMVPLIVALYFQASPSLKAVSYTHLILPPTFWIPAKRFSSAKRKRSGLLIMCWSTARDGSAVPE